ncbi:MAG: LLM class F420-dependent oxidoreductase [Acidimicrobiales bacterium]
MQFGLLTPVLSLSPGKYSPWELDGTIEDVAKIAATAEGLGYDYLTCSEHVAIPVDHEGGFGGGQNPGARYWDPLPTFAYLAAGTRRIRFTTLVLVLSYHHPLSVAKRYGSLDRICNGRLNLGVGVGYLKPEFELLGVPFDDRNARSDDALRAIRASFGRTTPEYEGTFFRFSGMVIDPCGLQEDVPLWVGGRTRRSLRRAVELGDVWCPFALSDEQLRSWLDEAAKTDAWNARRRPLDVAVSTTVDPLRAPLETAARVAALREAGATRLTLRFAHDSFAHYVEQLEAMMELATARGLVTEAPL